MSVDGRVPVGDALPGLAVHPIPDNWTPLAAIVLVKALDEDGASSWCFRTTSGLNDEELLGAITVRRDLLRAELLELYRDGEEDD